MGKKWYKIGEKDFIKVGRVITIKAGHETLCFTRTNNGYGAICNKCPHQGGPLGDGFIEKRYENGHEWVICPWHGYEYDPISGRPPGGHSDVAESFEVEEREDGIYVAVIDEEIHKITIMDQMVETMNEWGVKVVFGMVGHSNLGLADAFYKAEKQGKMKYFGIRHENAAAFAASGYAKLTGNPAACFAIAGPGATNLLTGLWDAKVDRVPILALTGQVQTQILGPGAFQEVPLDKAFEAVSVWSQTVISPNNATELMALAIKNAIVHRDVAHLIFPDEVQTLPGLEPQIKPPKEGRISNTKIIPDDNIIVNLVNEINSSLRPTIIIGNGARNSANLILKMAEKIDAAIITTFKAKGTISENHPLACGVLGRSGTPVSSAVMGTSDLLIVLGASFSTHTSISTKKKTIQIDFDRMTLGKFHSVDIAVWGEIGLTLNKLLPNLVEKSRQNVRFYIQTRWEKWRKEKALRSSTYTKSGRIPNAKIFEILSNYIPADSIIAVDVGNNTYAFGMYFESKTHSLLMSGYLGSIGFAFPAAMGAWVAQPEKRIFAIAGDGGFGQYAMEFTTAVKYKMNIVLVLLNNSELGKISREQRGAKTHVFATDLVNPNFAKFADNCGGYGVRVENENQLREAFEGMSAKNGPMIIEIISSADQL